ncbi:MULTISPECIES: LCP family protein [unclassified Parafrankia]|uniref:LCP family protein n=1 Tax=unclassified Parafrankia TaxID=2994368 RepID=UPI000DA57281|nr:MULTISPECIES: LCP family protein [unclassified Parafrankia]TCJ34435.1 LytR family transcriptional regulator [Parafrankia sp. BMG5.11]SQE00050.1 Cell envelope-related transcriptional attenuator, LytR family [Parafrankia sp. Ea1.12]
MRRPRDELSAERSDLTWSDAAEPPAPATWRPPSPREPHFREARVAEPNLPEPRSAEPYFTEARLAEPTPAIGSHAALPPELSPRLVRRRRSPLRRLSVTLVAMISLCVLGATSVGWAAYRHFDSAIDRKDWTPVAGARPAVVPGDLNVLLLGNDSREGTHGEFGDPGGIRADTTIVAHFDADRSVTLVSFPRDTLVPVVPAAAATAPDGLSKIADVIPLAGVPGLISTLEAFTGLKIDHTVSINLAGFRAMTDAVGGVTVCVRPLPDGSTRNFRDRESGWRGQLGENRLNGDQALAFVRTRKALGEERLRILRQQQFLSRLLDAATSAGVLTNPARITSLLGAVGGALQISDSLTQTEMLRLAKRISELGPGGLRFITIPTYVPLPSAGAVDEMGTIPPHGMVLLHDPAGLEAIVGPMRATAENGGGSGSPTAPGVSVAAGAAPGATTPGGTAQASPSASPSGTASAGTASAGTTATGTTADRTAAAGTTPLPGTAAGTASAVPVPADTSCTP